MRGGVKVKYFDMDLDWVGKFRNYNQATFWSADTDEGQYLCPQYICDMKTKSW
jgi:hypothetical protein